ncbi:pyruvate kinase 2, cytosolic-like [Papaver somniferum]|uniref:pyruvate kinase 2, cytosolic-like n=1 Tax=Papaver somniferum TaxID=3469 RepID=UPI000E700C9B|nr:pyruvate kinase 2, cytosolic-like [Papaver somniferum]
MLDTIGPELQVLNKSEKSIALKAESSVVLTSDQDKEATSDVLPINYDGLAKAVKKGDTIFLGQYLFTGSETTSVWLEICTLPGSGAADMYSNCKQRIYTRISYIPTSSSNIGSESLWNSMLCPLNSVSHWNVASAPFSSRRSLEFHPDDSPLAYLHVPDFVTSGLPDVPSYCAA